MGAFFGAGFLGFGFAGCDSDAELAAAAGFAPLLFLAALGFAMFAASAAAGFAASVSLDLAAVFFATLDFATFQPA